MYNIISDVRFMATDTGMIVCTSGKDLDDTGTFPLLAVSCLVQVGQKTWSQDSQ